MGVSSHDLLPDVVFDGWSIIIMFSLFCQVCFSLDVINFASSVILKGSVTLSHIIHFDALLKDIIFSMV